jgi:hypothetical protein
VKNVSEILLRTAGQGAPQALLFVPNAHDTQLQRCRIACTRETQAGSRQLHEMPPAHTHTHTF